MANIETSQELEYPSGLPADFMALLKPRVMSLVVFTALVGMVAAPGSLHPVLGAISLFAIALGAGASGALNMWFDADIDAKMSRTRRRPIPSGRLTANDALVFGTFLSVVAVLLLSAAASYIAGAFLAFTIFFYVVIYSIGLKRRTPLNIVIGGAAGAFPPMIGWTVATGGVDVNSVLLFAIIFLWTPPHFWALALYKRSDYAAAGIPMMPVIKGAANTRRQMLFYTILVSAIGIAPAFTGLGGIGYALVSIVCGAVFLWLAIQVFLSKAGETVSDAKGNLYEVEKGDKVARNMFAFSILYLFALFAALLVEHGLGLYFAIPLAF